MGCESSIPAAAAAEQPAKVSTVKNPYANLTPEQISMLTDEQIAAIEMGGKKFMQKLKEVDMTRDYTIIVDASGSMFNGANWNEARKAVEFLAPSACKCDPDGITLYFFSNAFLRYEKVKSEEEVLVQFEAKKNHLSSSTDLARVLKDALLPDTVSASGESSRPETILVITDGCPDDKKKVEHVIIEATKKMKDDEDLSITLIQVGNDPDAAAWLAKLDEDLVKAGAKFDIVDCMPADAFKGANFSEIVKKSIGD